MDLPVRSPKLALSTAEWQLAFSDAFILTKLRIIAEVYEIFGCLSDAYRLQASPLAIKYPAAFAGQPKISKGEQYEQMPWVMLDYPRLFDKQGHFAIRSFFWWGHHFSIRLQLSGEYAINFAAATQQLVARGWLVGQTSDPWDYALPNAHWQSMEAGITANNWLMAGKKMPVTNWQQAFEFYVAAYAELVTVLQA